MKITSGCLKGKKIKSKKGLSTRPLLSRIRKSLFDLLGDGIKDKKFLDLYAGSGAVGIEAISRGASEAVFVDKDPECVKIIRENLLKLGISSAARVFQQDVLQILPFLLKKEEFPFIFIGPPYFLGLQDRTLDIIEKLVNYRGGLIIQHHPREKVKLERRNMTVIQQRKYGDICLTFIRKEKNG